MASGKSSVSSAAVWNACFYLLAEGENPSLPKIYEKLGHIGNAQIIEQYLKEWRIHVGRRGTEALPRPGLPDHLVAIADRHVQKLFDTAMDVAKAALETERAKVKAELVEVNELLQVERNLLALARGELHEKNHVCELLQKQLSHLTDTCASSKREVSQLTSKCQELEAALVQKKSELLACVSEHARSLERQSVAFSTEQSTLTSRIDVERERSLRERERHQAEAESLRSEHTASASVLRTEVARIGALLQDAQARAEAAENCARTKDCPSRKCGSELLRQHVR